MRNHTRFAKLLVVGLAGLVGAAATAAEPASRALKPASAVRAKPAAEVAAEPVAPRAEAQETKQPEAEPASRLVEVTIRMPDGRVITRLEPRFASRVEVSEEDGAPELITGSGGVRSASDGSAGRGGGGGGAAAALTAAGAAGGGKGGGGGGGGSGGGGGGGGGGSGGAYGAFPGKSGNTGGGGNNSAPQGGTDGDSHEGRRANVYTWDRSTPEPFRNMVQTILLRPASMPAEQLANRIAARIQTEAPPKVVFRFWQELDIATRNPFDQSDPVELWRRGGFRDGMEEYWRTFATQLKRRGVTPDYLVQDLEKGISFWHVEPEDRRAFFGALLDNAHRLTGVLPSEFLSVDLQTFLDRKPAADPAHKAYSDAALQLRTDIIRETMHRPFVEAYERTIDHSNYNDMKMSFTVLRHYNSPWSETTIHGISAPSSYITNYGSAGSLYNRLPKHNRWNHLIITINAIRSAAAAGPVHPWISPPGYGARGPDTWCTARQLDNEKWLWEQFMLHNMALGVDTYILWNPPQRWNPHAAETDRFMDEWFGEHLANHEVLHLDPIPLDAGVIETNGVVTRYEDFIARFAE